MQHDHAYVGILISLIKRIVAGLAVGAVLGIAFPNAEAVGLLGTLFVSALKGVAPILVFFLVISALANARAAGSMKTVVLLYVVSTFVAALVAGGPRAQSVATELIRAVAGRPIDEAVIEDTAQRIAALRATPEAREGLGAFLDKRRPAWTSK